LRPIANFLNASFTSDERRHHAPLNALKSQPSSILSPPGCTCDGTDFFLDECTYKGVIPLFLPPHSSDQTQPLDLGIFGVQKSEAAKVRPSAQLNPQTRQVIKAIAGYQKACTPSNVVNAFRRAGIATGWSGEHSALIARVERSGADKIRHWTYEKRRIPLRASFHVPTSAVPPE
jgi:hypothetical protein